MATTPTARASCPTPEVAADHVVPEREAVPWPPRSPGRAVGMRNKGPRPRRREKRRRRQTARSARGAGDDGPRTAVPAGARPAWSATAPAPPRPGPPPQPAGLDRPRCRRSSSPPPTAAPPGRPESAQRRRVAPGDRPTSQGSCNGRLNREGRRGGRGQRLPVTIAADHRSHPEHRHRHRQQKRSGAGSPRRPCRGETVARQGVGATRPGAVGSAKGALA